MEFNMKKLMFFAVITAFILTSTHLFSQIKTEETKTTTDSTGKSVTTQSLIISKSEDITPINNVIVLNPLKFILYYNLSYYRKINNSLVLGGGLQIPTIKDIKGWGLNLEARLHPSAKGPRGFYVAPNFSYNSISSTYHDTYNTQSEQSVSSTSLGVLLGWQWFPGDEFAIGLGIGTDYYFLSTSDKYGLFGSYDGWIPALRFDIGYAW
jgi:hypothetical protein